MAVIQTEATIEYLLQGRNPYVEDYVATPMAEWGINEFRTALYHYPYLPWTFLFSAPFRLLADRTIGWYDQRLVYLILFALTLLLAPGLARRLESKLLLVMIIGLNPIMGSDLIYGQNDSFVLAWVLLSLWLWGRGQQAPHGFAPGPLGANGTVGVAEAAGAGRPTGWLWASAAAFGLACASKPTAWFLLPFTCCCLQETQDHGAGPGSGRRAWVRGWPALP
jgi:4-amino-4-deoxy-L-arabinose transferase-like glycosyltransferase